MGGMGEGSVNKIKELEVWKCEGHSLELEADSKLHSNF